jgi:hypothetical protein
MRLALEAKSSFGASSFAIKRALSALLPTLSSTLETNHKKLDFLPYHFVQTKHAQFPYLPFPSLVFLSFLNLNFETKQNANPKYFG